jgi:hypothetical protein
MNQAYTPEAIVTDDTPVRIADGSVVPLKEALQRTATAEPSAEEVEAVAMAIADVADQECDTLGHYYSEGELADIARAAIIRLDQVREAKPNLATLDPSQP